MQTKDQIIGQQAAEIELLKKENEALKEAVKNNLPVGLRPRIDYLESFKSVSLSMIESQCYQMRSLKRYTKHLLQRGA